jgi:hypothetical protein
MIGTNKERIRLMFSRTIRGHFIFGHGYQRPSKMTFIVSRPLSCSGLVRMCNG